MNYDKYLKHKPKKNIMKNPILVMALSVLITVAITTSCSSPTEKLNAAQKDVTDANLALDQANKEFVADVEKTREDAASTISENEKSIAEFNERILNKKADLKAEYKKKIDELEQKNTDLKRKIDEYNAETKEEWAEFKAEFFHDLDELKKALSDFNVANLK